MKKVLIVDDEIGILESLTMSLEGQYAVFTATDGASGLALFKHELPDLTLLDIVMPGMDGQELLKEIKAIKADAKIIMLTALHSVKSAVDAMKCGAYDYITKPFNFDELLIVIEKALETKKLEEEVKTLRSEVIKRYSFHNIIGKSKEMQELYRTIEQIADKNATVLIYGESGTGKELVAKAIHYYSPRNNNTFTAINCAAISENLIESELFGHEKGAFTDARQRKIGRFEIAHKGTLLLDEVADLSPATQAKILRVLQEREFTRVGGTENVKVDVRLIAATNKNLEALVHRGGFREDLYYRLNVVSIFLPPLSQRKEDIPLLAEYFLKEFYTDGKGSVKSISKDAMEMLAHYDWPGNVRELKNVLERAVAFCSDDVVDVDALPPKIRESLRLSRLKETVVDGRLPFEDAQKEFEYDILLNALKKTDFVQTKAAKLLGISRRMLKYKMDKLRIKNKGKR